MTRLFSYKEFYPSGASESDSFSRIISTRHFQRLSKLLAGTKGNIAFGGDKNEEAKYIGPTVVENVTGDDSLMSESVDILRSISLRTDYVFDCKRDFWSYSCDYPSGFPPGGD